MSSMLDIVVRSSALLSLGWIAVWLLRRRAASIRHGLLAAAIAGAALVVPLSRVVPPVRMTLPASSPAPLDSLPPAEGVPARTAGEIVAATQPAAGFPVALTLRTMWVAGTAAHLAVLLLGLWRLRRFRDAGRDASDEDWIRAARQLSARHGVRRPVRVLIAPAGDMVATWGLWRPVVMLPEGARAWPAARMHAVLSHELAHVARRDWLWQVAAEAVRALYWFNPFMVAACRRLRQESELACDDRVLDAGLPADEYAGHLIALARLSRGRPIAAALPMARPSALERRIEAMFEHRSSRAALGRRGVAGVAAAAAVAVLSTAALQAGQAGPRALTGTVYDPSGAVLPQVAITLVDERENRWQTTSDAAGRFEFPAMGQGTYTLGASLPGFRPLDERMILSAPSDWDRAVTLQVGEVRETIAVRAARTAGGQPAAAEAAPVRVGGNIKPPRKLRHVAPIYPPAMQAAGLEGTVPIEAVIGTDGRVTSSRVLTSQVHPDFAAAALSAVREWQFSPTLLNGKPVEVRVSVSIDFALED